MCMADSADGYCTTINQAWRKAAKKHRCSECRRQILPGEGYRYEFTRFDGEVSQHHTCEHCLVARQWLMENCGGWLYGGVEEDIQEHADSGMYGFGVRLLAIGMERKWTRKDGRRWPIPRLPKTGHDLAKEAAQIR